jgi:hypothetical protein
MNDLGYALIGLAVRGTVFAAVGLAIGLLLRRRGPSASAMVALATLVGLVGISALAASPWPHWWSLGDSEAGPANRQVVATSPAPPDRPDSSAAPSPDGKDAVLAVPPAKADGDPAGPSIIVALRELGRALMRPPAAADADRWGWQAWLAAVAIAGVSLGLGRFALGMAAVAALRARSRPVVDEGLLALARRLRGELAIDGEVALRVSPGLATPATVGWLRPAILLPEDWTGWDDRERQVVLSHELAHIRRNDYLAGLWAQLSLALHYYHPLAHWLARRLRLEQELAADAWGARLSGGPRPYLAALARMALRNDPRPVGWPARSFRPARGTFLRRIEMLRDANELQTSPLPRPTRAVAIGALVLAGLALAGLRGPGSTRMAGASPLGPQAGATGEHDFISAHTAATAAIRLGGGGVPPQVSAQGVDRQGKTSDGKSPAAPVYIDVRSVLSDDVKRTVGPEGIVTYGLKYEDIDRLMADVPSIERSLPIRAFRKPIHMLNRSIDGRVVGTTHDYPGFYGLKMARGRFLTAADNARYENYAVLGPEVARTLFPAEDPVGKPVRVGSDYYTVLGVVEERANLPGVGGESETQAINKSVYLPLSTCRLRFGERIVNDRPPGAARFEESQLSRLILQLHDGANAEHTATLIKSRLKPFYPRGDVEVEIIPGRKTK